MSVTPYFDAYEKTKRRSDDMRNNKSFHAYFDVEFTHKDLYNFSFWMKKPYISTTPYNLSELYSPYIPSTRSVVYIQDFSPTLVDC